MRASRFTWALLVAALAAMAAVPPALAQSDWQSGAGADWKKALEGARKEGKVVVSVAQPQLAQTVPAAFERDTGIKAEIQSGNPADLSGRYGREARSGNVTIDLMLGGPVELVTLHPDGLLNPLKPQLLLPGVKDPKNWVGGFVKWSDPEQQYLLQTTEYMTARPVVNRDVVDAKKLTSWKDLLKPEYKGKIAIYDPRVAGPGQAMATYIVASFGIDFLKELYIGQQGTFTRDGRQLTEWVARGTYPIALGLIHSSLEQFRSQGFKTIDYIALPDAPGMKVGGFSVAKQMKNVPHPNAATVFLNWFASRPGQEINSRTGLEVSRRIDVKVEGVELAPAPEPGVTYVDYYEPEFYLKTSPGVTEQAIQALGGR